MADNELSTSGSSLSFLSASNSSSSSTNYGDDVVSSTRDHIAVINGSTSSRYSPTATASTILSVVVTSSFDNVSRFASWTTQQVVSALLRNDDDDDAWNATGTGNTTSSADRPEVELTATTEGRTEDVSKALSWSATSSSSIRSRVDTAAAAATSTVVELLSSRITATAIASSSSDLVTRSYFNTSTTTTPRFFDFTNEDSANSSFFDGTTTAAAAEQVLLRHSSVVYAFITCLLLGLIILATIVGNVFVIAAVVLERNLHSVANYLIASLAVADLMVAALVMPLAAVNEVSTRWFLGREACDAFISFDVLCCTASILHLVAISVDRYWAVTRADYIHNRPARRIIIMIALSWAISAVISIPPLFGWKSNDGDPDSTGVCLISQDWAYTVYSTVGAFYMPLALMIIIYLNVYRAARLRIRKKNFRQRHVTRPAERESTTWISSLMNGARGRCAAPTATLTQQSSVAETPTTPPCFLLPPDISIDANMAAAAAGTEQPLTPTSPMLPDPTQTMSMSPLLPVDWPPPHDGGGNGVEGAEEVGGGSPLLPISPSPTTAELMTSQRLLIERRAKKKREQTRERKAARTLGVITGSFVVCWLPFFILALLRPFCGSACDYPDLLVSIIIWLGYFNSLLNPVIYTIFNPDFRSAFRKILFGKYRTQSSSSRISVGGGVGGGRRRQPPAAAVTTNGGGHGPATDQGQAHCDDTTRTGCCR